MTRTQRLEAALRELLDASVALEAAIHSEPDMSGHLKNIHISTVRGEAPLRRFQVVIGDAATALADTSPSCCEEVRRAALEEAAQVADKGPTALREFGAEVAHRVLHAKYPFDAQAIVDAVLKGSQS